MELHQLRYFVAVAETGSFTRAAEREGVTQPTLSEQVIRLESERHGVGRRLFDRLGRKVVLTEAGNVLLGHAEAITARLAAARADVHALAEGAAGTLRIGSYQSVGTRILPAVMRDFTAAWPDVNVQLVEEASDEGLLPLVERGELDVTFTVYPIPEGPFEAVELFRDPFVLLVQAGSPLAVRGEPPTLREIGELPLIGYRQNRNTDERLRVRGIEPNVIFRSDDNGTVHGLVAAGMGAAVIPSLSVDPHHEGVLALPLGNRVTPRLVGLAWHKDRYRLPAARAFVETAQDVCAGLAEAA
jgi:DNA-binding transcriptional LysR family regulator